jgi:hypothetical protein
VLIAVVSGVVWYHVTKEDTTTPVSGDDTEQQRTEGAYEFTAHPDTRAPDTDSDCAGHAYGDIKDYLAGSPCDHLSRQLFVAKVDGRTIYTSVSVVTMPDEEKADELRKLTDKDGSGNVADVVKDGLAEVDGLDRLTKGGGYASKQSGRDVVIVEADFPPADRSGDEQADEDILDKVCEDALRLSTEIADNSG